MSSSDIQRRLEERGQRWNPSRRYVTIKEAIHPLGRFVLEESWVNVYSTEGYLPQYMEGEEICFIGSDGQFQILEHEGLSRLKGYSRDDR